MAHPNPARSWIFAGLLAAIIGIIDAAVLTAQHYRIASKGLMQKSFCTLSPLIDCDVVLTSPYARIGTILNSEIGLLFYLLIALLLIWALASERQRRTLFSFILIATSGALLYSIYMGYILFEKLQVICLLCIASYLVTLALFLFALKLNGVKPWRWPAFVIDYLKRTLSMPTDVTQKTGFFKYLFVSVVVYGVGILFFFGLNKPAHSRAPQFNREALIQHFYQQEAKSFDLGDRPAWGPANAPITIVDFSDFQCPFCRRAAFSLRPYLGEFRNQVRIVYVNYPLDSSCNPAIERRVHAQACMAAKAALCAAQKGSAAFWKYHDLIFENQRRLSHSLLTKVLAPQIGMSATEMGQCLISSEIEARLQQDVQLGNETKLGGTPSIYINGRFLNGWVEPSVLQTILAAELKRHSS